MPQTNDIPSESPPDKMGVPVLWFDAKGRGPDEFLLEITRMVDKDKEAIPTTIGVRVRAGGMVIMGAPLIDGGFMIDLESARMLRDALGAVLEE